MQIIEKVKSWLTADQVENRLFLFALVLATPYFGSSLLFDFLNNSSLFFKTLDMSLLGICLALLYLSKRRKLLPYLIHFFCFLIIAGGVAYWGLSGGIASGGSYVFMVILVLVILMSGKKLRLAFTLLLTALLFTLASGAFEFEAEIIYHSLLFDYVLNLIMLSILLTLFRLAMDKEQKDLEDQNVEMARVNNELTQKTKQLEEYNSEIKSIQENLEEIVKQRSEKLEDEHKLDVEYAFINAHLIRAPIANIIGLTEVVEDFPDEINELRHNISDLDSIVRKIGKVLSE